MKTTLKNTSIFILATLALCLQSIADVKADLAKVKVAVAAMEAANPMVEDWSPKVYFSKDKTGVDLNLAYCRKLENIDALPMPVARRIARDPDRQRRTG